MEMTLAKDVFSDIKFKISLHLELESILVKIVNFEKFIVMSASELNGKLNLRVVAHKSPENARNIVHVIVKRAFIF